MLKANNIIIYINIIHLYLCAIVTRDIIKYLCTGRTKLRVAKMSEITLENGIIQFVTQHFDHHRHYNIFMRKFFFLRVTYNICFY